MKFQTKTISSDKFCFIALENRDPDKTFYLPYDLERRNNLHYHHPEYYPFDFEREGYKLVTAQINNITLKVKRYIINFIETYFIAIYSTLIISNMFFSFLYHPCCHNLHMSPCFVMKKSFREKVKTVGRSGASAYTDLEYV